MGKKKILFAASEIWMGTDMYEKKENYRKNKLDVTVHFAVAGIYHCGGGGREGGGERNRFASEARGGSWWLYSGIV